MYSIWFVIYLIFFIRLLQQSAQTILFTADYRCRVQSEIIKGCSKFMKRTANLFNKKIGSLVYVREWEGKSERRQKASRDLGNWCIYRTKYKYTSKNVQGLCLSSLFLFVFPLERENLNNEETVSVDCVKTEARDCRRVSRGKQTRG